MPTLIRMKVKITLPHKENHMCAEKNHYMIVTEADQLLCPTCYEENFTETELSTHCLTTIPHGKCDHCGVEIQKPTNKDTP